MVNVPPWVGTEWEEKGNWPITDFDKYMVHVGNLTGGDIERYVVHRNYVANTTTPFNLNFCRNILITGLSKHNFANPPPPNSTPPPPTNRWQVLVYSILHRRCGLHIEHHCTYTALAIIRTKTRDNSIFLLDFAGELFVIFNKEQENKMK